MNTALKDRNYFFLIEESIYDRLITLVNTNNRKHSNGKFKIKLDVVAFFINLISYRESLTKDKFDFGFVPLKAEYLKKYHHQYKVYFDFLEEHRFIAVKTYSIKRKKCKRYKLIKPDSLGSFKSFYPNDFVLRKRLGIELQNKTSKADRSTKHLTKWLSPEYLKIDYNKALHYLKSIKMQPSKIYSRRYSVEAINNGKITYQREGKDNRLHSTLTNLPKDLRQFLRYQDSTLVSLDLKSSQPYILCGFLNSLYHSNHRNIEEFLNKVVHNNSHKNQIHKAITIMMQETAETLVIEALGQFEKLLKTDIYKYIGKHLTPEFRYDIETPLGITDKFYNKKLGTKVTKHFDSIRDYCKVIMLEYLYCSPKNKEKRYLEVKRILPKEISKIIDLLKSGDKSIFPIFLQNLESYLILDLITKNISKENPNLPLYTIHDSIITIPSKAEYVKNQMENHLEEYLGIKPEIQCERWVDKMLSDLN